MAQYPSRIALSSLNGKNGFSLDYRPYDMYYDGSRTIAGTSAGDVNGDGFSDLLVRTYYNYRGYDHGGTAYVIYGKSSGFSKAEDSASSSASRGFSIDFGGYEPTGIASGDVNGDGFSDVAIGVYGVSYDGSIPGAAYVIFGKAGGPGASVDPNTLNGTNGFKIVSDDAYDYLGQSVSVADVNGDGLADVIVGDPGADRAYVVFGKASGFGATVDVSTLDGTNGFSIEGGTRFGNVVSAGDVNGDGFADVIVNGTYVVFGKASGFSAAVDVATLDGSNGFKIGGASGGRSVASAGDLNADGYDDLVLGDPTAGAKQSASGAAYVIFGKAGGFDASMNVASLDGTNGFKLVGAAVGDGAGISVSSAGDVNGDGYDDLLIGASRVNRATNGGGAAYVLFGKADGFGKTVDLGTLDGTNGFEVTGGREDGAGEIVSAAGDLNGDGFADISVTTENGAYIVFGRAPDAAVNRSGTAISQTIAGGDFADRLIGKGGDDTLRGNGGNDYLEGDSGSDMLGGGAGADTMNGGIGNDTYYVDNVGDKVIEGRGMGNDTVRSAVTFSVAGQYVETLVLTGGTAIDGTGNGLANTMIGNNKNNVLTGGRGNDVLTGNGGADTFVYHANWGRDSIADFAAGNTAGHDTVNIDKSLFASYSEMMAHTMDTSAGAVVTYDSHDTITFDHLQKADLTSADFKFT